MADHKPQQHHALWKPWGDRGIAPDDRTLTPDRILERQEVFPRSLQYTRSGNYANAEVFGEAGQSGQLLPMLWNSRQSQGAANVVTGPVQLDMLWDGLFPELLPLPMILSRTYNALVPARYVWERIVSTGEIRKRGIGIGVLPQTADSGVLPFENSAHLWHASGPMRKISSDRYRVTAFPVVFPVYEAQAIAEWVLVGEECYIWEPEPLITPSNFTEGDVLSEYPTDPVIYDLWEFRFRGVQAPLTFDGSTTDIFSSYGWLVSSNTGNTFYFRMLIARDALGIASRGSGIVFSTGTIAWVNGSLHWIGQPIIHSLSSYVNNIPVSQSVTDRSYRNYVGVSRSTVYVLQGGSAPEGGVYMGTITVPGDYWIFSPTGALVSSHVVEVFFDGVVPEGSVYVPRKGPVDVYMITSRHFTSRGPGAPPPYLDPDVFGSCGIPATAVSAAEIVGEQEAINSQNPPPEEPSTFVANPVTEECIGSIEYIWTVLPGFTTSDSGSAVYGWVAQEGSCAPGCGVTAPVGSGTPGQSVLVDCEPL